jgi:hydroxyethylthiazole kinase-like uncharacterized protein yjeF
MVKIPTAEQIRHLDAQTIASEPIASIELMERACLAFVQWFVPRFDHRRRIGIVCGTGNNGGDGLAIARLLRERRYSVVVWIVRGSGKETADFKANRERLASVEVTELINAAPGAFDNAEILIDALFGSGLSRPLEQPYSGVVKEMNRTSARRIAVDIPSGLLADAPSSGDIVQAHDTVTFQMPKLAFMFPSNEPFVGVWHIVDIGLSKQSIDEIKTSHHYITQQWVGAHIPRRKKFAHKGDVGRSLLVAGSHGKIGACILSARALLRTGAGLLTVHVPQCGDKILQIAVPEAMVSTDDENDFVTKVEVPAEIDAIGMGPGLGTRKETIVAIGQLMNSRKPLVIDADGLNILAGDKKLMKLLPPGSILTPHPGEFRRLCGIWQNDFERLELQKKFARETGCVVVLKGAHTSIATPDGEVYFNSTGNPGMATAGSGDVLTGMLTSLLAQRYDPIDAAIVGVFLHGRAGDLALEGRGGHVIIASDIIDQIPRSFASFF